MLSTVVSQNIFYVPNFAPNSLLFKLSGLNTIESEIDLKKLLFWGRLITEPKMAPVLRFLFSSRVDSFLDANIHLGVFCKVFVIPCKSTTCFIILN